MTVTEVLGYYTYILEGGQKYNARRMKPWRKPGGIHLLDSQEGRNHETPAPQRSSRANKGQSAKRVDPYDQSS